MGGARAKPGSRAGPSLPVIARKRQGKATPLSSIITVSPTALRSNYTCNLCHVVLNSIEQYHAHLQGARHQSNANGGSAEDPKNGSPVLQVSSVVVVSNSSSCETSSSKVSIRKRWATFNSDDNSGGSSPTVPETPVLGGGASYFQEGLQTSLFSGVLMKRSRMLY